MKNVLSRLGFLAIAAMVSVAVSSLSLPSAEAATVVVRSTLKKVHDNTLVLDNGFKVDLSDKTDVVLFADGLRVPRNKIKLLEGHALEALIVNGKTKGVMIFDR